MNNYQKIYAVLFVSLLTIASNSHCASASEPVMTSLQQRKNLYDQHIDLHEQDLLINQLVKYLKKESRDPEFIKEIDKSGGFCLALSFLWAYGKRLQDEPITDPTKERDDYNFFNNTYRLITTWDGKTDFTPSEKQIIDRFLSHIVLYQNEGGKAYLFNTGQYNVPTILEDTKGRKLKYDVVYALILSKSALISYLEKIITPKTILKFGIASRHAISIYQNTDGTLEFYDSNNKKGSLSFNSMEELINSNSIQDLSNDYQNDNYPYSINCVRYRFPDDPQDDRFAQKNFQLTEDELSSLINKKLNEKLVFSLKMLEQNLPYDLIAQILKSDDIKVEKKILLLLRCIENEVNPLIRDKLNEIQSDPVYIMNVVKELLKGINVEFFYKCGIPDTWKQKHNLDLDVFNQDEVMRAIKPAIPMQKLWATKGLEAILQQPIRTPGTISAINIPPAPKPATPVED